MATSAEPPGPHAHACAHELTRRELLLALAAVSAGLLAPDAGGNAGLAPALAPGRAPSPPRGGRAQAFDLSAVRLLDGPFQRAQQLDLRYLMTLEPDRLLHNFRVNAGLDPKAAVYGGWESQEPWVEIRCHGHTLGHYLSACSLMYASTGDAGCAERVHYIVAELAACQLARGDGLVCAFPDGAAPLLLSVEGKPFPGVPWYTQHKLLAGLRDAWLHTGSDEARTVLLALADWSAKAVATLPDDRLQKLLEVEHGGMNEVLADAYAIGGDAQHLDAAQRFCQRALLEPLAQGSDTLDGLHSNTQIPKVIGFQRLHELTGRADYGNAAQFFWQTVTARRSFATGGNGDGEHFFPTAEFAAHVASAKTMETCCTHNMLKLTRALFQQAPAAAYADYYERALFNGILASQDPDSGMMTYFQATRPGYPKLYCTPMESFWCCTGSGMENHAKYGDSIYFWQANTLYVNLFIASALDWREQGVRVTQTTRFPDEAGTRLVFQTARPTRLRVKLRQPAWCREALVSVNGRAIERSTSPGSYIDVERTWRDGDRLELALPMQLQLVPLPGVAGIAALMYGPVVLAGRMGNEGITPGSDLLVNERRYGEVLDLPIGMPRLAATPGNLARSVARKPGDALAFTVRTAGTARDIELVPFHRIAHERYNLYWQLS